VIVANAKVMNDCYYSGDNYYLMDLVN